MPAAVRVLVVDDEPGAIELIRDILESESGYGYRVDGAGSVADARASIATQQPDLLILDVVLRGSGSSDRDGRAFLAELRAQPATATLPVLLMTSLHVLNEERDQTAHTAHLAKPYDLVELLTVVERLTTVRS